MLDAALHATEASPWAIAALFALWTAYKRQLDLRLLAATVLLCCGVVRLELVPPLDGDLQDNLLLLVGLVTVVYLAAPLLARRRQPDDGVIHRDHLARDLKIVGRERYPGIPQYGLVVQELRQCFDSGMTRPVAARLEQLRQLRRFVVENEAAIAKALHIDLGRPKFEAIVEDVLLPVREIEHMIRNLEGYAGPERVAGSPLTFPSEQWIQPEPQGVVLVMTSWEYPFKASLVPACAAIAAGNTVLLKPSVFANESARLMAELLPRYVDPRVLTCVGADQPADCDSNTALLSLPFDHIFFSGTTEDGRIVAQAAAPRLTPCTLELRGKNPVFVDANCNLDLAAKLTMWGRNLNAGQHRTAPDYVLCDEAVAAEFCELCKGWAVKLYGDNPKDSGSFGRIVGQDMARFVSLLDAEEGGTAVDGDGEGEPGAGAECSIVCGGFYHEKDRYVEPTVVRATAASRFMQAELFGPILVVVPVGSVEDGLELVRERDPPVSVYVFSNDPAFQQTVVGNTRAQGVGINTVVLQAKHPGLGLGATSGEAAFRAFSHRKAVLRSARPAWAAEPTWLLPPWTHLKLSVARWLARLS